MATSSSIDFVNGTANSTAGALINPKGVLGKDDFLKLLMTQLKYQDPTSPMDTDKMVAQTADMAVIESQANMQIELEKMVKQFRHTASYQLIGAVGKLADTGMNGIEFKNGGTFYQDILYFEEPFDNGLLSIIDSNGNNIRTIQLGEGDSGLQSVSWDGKDSFGNTVEAGIYTMRANYVGLISGKQFVSELGVYPIESVVLSGETPKLLVGGDYLTLNDIVAIKDRP